MKQFLILAALFIGSLLIAEEPLNSFLLDPMQGPILHHAVNVITGHYSEVENDLASGGHDKLVLKRGYFQYDPRKTDYDTRDVAEGWRFNLPLFESKEAAEKFETDHPELKFTWEDDLLVQVELFDKESEKILGGFNFYYSGQSPIHLKAVSFEGNQVDYTIQKETKGRYANQLYILSAKAEGRPITDYSYIQHPFQRHLILSKRTEEGGRFIRLDYFGNEDGIYRSGKIKAEYAPAGENGEEIAIAQFNYNEKQTEVFDAAGKKTLYTYHPFGMIESVSFFDSSDKLLKKERYFWELNPVNFSINLKCKVLENGRGQTYFACKLEYSPRGEKLKQTLYGNLSGTQNIYFRVDENGEPLFNEIGGDVESYSTTFLYDKKIIGKLLVKHSDDGVEERLTYKPGSDMPNASYTFAESKIWKREFFNYGTNNFINEHIIDDGKFQEIENLAGTSYRLIYRYEYDSFGRKTHATTSSFSLEHQKETLLEKLEWSYDINGRISSKKQWKNEADEKLQTQYTYDAAGRIIEEGVLTTKEGENPIQQSIFTSYDPHGNAIEIVLTDQSGGFKEIKRTYNCANRLIEEQCLDYHPDIDTNCQKKRYLRYNGLGQKIAECSECGNWTEFFWDDLGRQCQKILPAIEGIEGSAKIMAHTAYLNPESNSLVEINPDGVCLHTLFNARGSIVQKNFSDGSQENWEYALDGSLIRETLLDGITRTYERDPLKRITKLVLENKNKETAIYTFEYSGFQLKKCTDPEGRVTLFEYDALGNSNGIARLQGQDELLHIVEQRSNHSGKTPQKEVQPPSKIKQFGYTVNHLGQTVEEVYQCTKQGSYRIIFDALGQIAEIDHYDACKQHLKKEERRYNSQGLLLLQRELIHPNTELEKIAEGHLYYDLHGKVVKEEKRTVSGEHQFIEHAYDSFGRQIITCLADGTTLFKEWDSWNHLQHLFSSDASIHYSFTHNFLGELTSSTNHISGEITSLERDASGLLYKDQQAGGAALCHFYDKSGKRIKTVLPDGSCILYEWEHESSSQRLLNITRQNCFGEDLYSHVFLNYLEDNDQKTGIWTRSKMGGKAGVIERTFNEKNEPSSLKSPYETIFYHYDDGRLSQIDQVDQSLKQFEYDEGGRIIKCGEETFSFDPNGNPLTSNEIYSPDNALLKKGSEIFEYDASGNMIARKGSDQQFEFSYDALNRLIKVIENDTKKTEYHYDGLGRRTLKVFFERQNADDAWKEINRFTTLYDGQMPIAELNQDGNIYALRVIPPTAISEIGEAVSIEMGGSFYAPLHDFQGSITSLIDMESGKLFATYSYSCFGDKTVQSENLEAAASLPWGYMSKTEDKESSLIFYGVRYFAPDLKRWITRDPMGSFDSFNAYLFLRNDPVNHLDWQGHFSIKNLFHLFWKQLKSDIDSIITCFYTFSGSLLDRINYIRHITPHMRELIASATSDLILTMTGMFEEEPETGIIGFGEASSKVRITLMNGMLCSREDFVGQAELISKYHGGVNIHFIFRQSHGWGSDLVKCLLIRLGYLSPRAKELSKVWKELIDEMGGVDGGGLIIHYAHSIGGAETYRAQFLLTAEEKKMIRVITIGSALLIPDEGFESVCNYVSTKDPVPFTDLFRYMKARVHCPPHIVFLPSLSGSLPTDHLLLSATYNKLMRQLGAEFCRVFMPAMAI